MIRIDDVHAIRLIAQAAHVQFVPRLHHCIASYDEQDRITGGVLFTDYWGNGSSCQMHVACFNKHWASKAMLYLAFDYPFRQLGVKKVFGLVPEENVAARNFDLKLGFKIEYLVEDVFNNPVGLNGMYLLSMRKEDCKWLNMKMPYIEYAPLERTNNVNIPLLHLPTMGGMQ